MYVWSTAQTVGDGLCGASTSSFLHQLAAAIRAARGSVVEAPSQQVQEKRQRLRQPDD